MSGTINLVKRPHVEISQAVEVNLLLLFLPNFHVVKLPSKYFYLPICVAPNLSQSFFLYQAVVNEEP